MKKTIGFVLNAPVNYTETFLLQEFGLLEKAGYTVIIFEGSVSRQVSYPFQRIPSLPLQLKGWKEVKNNCKTLSNLLLSGFIPLLRFIYLELASGTSPYRILKRIWLNAHILSRKVDSLHFCFAEVAIQKELTASAIKAKMSVSLRGSDILIYPEKNKGCYHRLWKNVNKVHVVSQYILTQARELGLSQVTKTEVIPDSIDVKKISFNTSDIHLPLKILSSGRLEQVKDYDLALQVIQSLVNNKVAVQYTLIGKGSLKNELEQKIKEFGLEANVQLKGESEHSALLQEMSSYDLFLHCSKSEGLGVALLEAQAAGLLTLALDAGGTEESIEDQKSGWIVRERNPDTIAQKIIEILQLSESKRLKIKSYARKRVEEKFNITNVVSKWEAFFED